MAQWPALVMLALLSAESSAAAARVADMRGHRRVLLIAAPAQDSRAAEQRDILGGWTRQAADRDISLVEVAGVRVTGSSDYAAGLRKHYQLDARRFVVLLIGKDGNVALRSVQPVAADRLQAIIDAMPMRRAGER